MDFDNLPDNFFLEIFRRLPFKQRCRIGAVSRSFRRMSDICISQTKFLQLGLPEFTNLPVGSLSKISGLCRHNLEHVQLLGKFFESFVEFSFSRLARIELGLDDDHGFDWVEVILANNPALKELSLMLVDNHSGVFVSTGLTYANLTRLCVMPTTLRGAPIVDFKFLHLLTGRCPNLKQLVLFRCALSDEAQSAFDEFFAHCPILEELNLGFTSALNYFEMESFWRMESLRELVICNVSDYVSQRGDDFLVKVANSFPRLESLRVNDLRMTNQGVSSLASLENLCWLSMLSPDTDDLEASLWRLAQNGKLRMLFFECCVMPSTFLTIVSKCPNLHSLWLESIWNIETADAAAELLTSLGRWNTKRNLWFRFYDRMEIWRSPQVESAVKKLKDTADLNVTIHTHAAGY